MPERDSPIDFDDLPSIQAEKRHDAPVSQEASVAPAVKKAKPAEKSASGGGSSLALWLSGVLLILLIALGGLVYVQHQTAQQAEARIAVLEGRLSSTDESLSQSSVAVQVRLVELKERTDELWTQMDKLWASAWRRNQTDLAEQGKKIDDAAKALKALSTTQSQQEKLTAALKGENDQHKTDIQQLKTEVKTVAAAQKNTDQQQKAIADLRKQLDGLAAQQQKLQKQVDDAAGWIESNNAFRQQTNQTLSRLDQQLKALQKPAP